ncbi:MAG: type II toxin-antitoxin system ParD family antitoxin [Alphaproteobacteria bacterium]|nr:type II toxin-antitoxin system ParD family antitoxin [Alphaproteobacteria bacterium]MBF0393627.1 type II toxin-antitoxin system ParD family antitoxin [Alphaproteobacteria bacterium]
MSDEDEKSEVLRAALIDGEASGPPRPFDVEAFLRAKREDQRADFGRHTA